MPTKIAKRRRASVPAGRDQRQRWGDGPAYGYALLLVLARLGMWFVARPVDTVGPPFLDYIDHTPVTQLLHWQNAVTSILLAIFGLGALAFKALAALCMKPLVEKLSRPPLPGRRPLQRR